MAPSEGPLGDNGGAAGRENSPRVLSQRDLSGREFSRRDFSRRIEAVIGAAAAEALFDRAFTRLQRQGAGGIKKLEFMTAFFLHEYDDATMTLDDEDWQDMRKTIEDASEEMNLTTLTDLMDNLLSRGLLKQ
jgi:hypothetical protein